MSRSKLGELVKADPSLQPDLDDLIERRMGRLKKKHGADVDRLVALIGRQRVEIGRLRRERTELEAALARLVESDERTPTSSFISRLRELFRLVSRADTQTPEGVLHDKADRNRPVPRTD